MTQNEGKIKTAVCLSGHMRKFAENISTLRKHLLNNPELDCDIFIHTWKDIDKTFGIVHEKEIIGLYSPKKLIIEGRRNFPINKLVVNQNPDKRDANGLLSMFYKIKECNKLKSSYEIENNFTYDCVIRLRPDIKLKSDISINKSTDLQKLYIPMHGDYSGINDQFAFSNSHNMNIYSSTFDNIDRYLQQNIRLNPEFFMAENVKENQFQVERPYIPYVIVWGNGLVWDNETRHRAK